MLGESANCFPVLTRSEVFLNRMTNYAQLATILWLMWNQINLFSYMLFLSQIDTQNPYSHSDFNESMCTISSNPSCVFGIKDLSSSKSLTKFRWIDNNIQIMERKFLKFYQIQSLRVLLVRINTDLPFIGISS